MKVNHNMTAVRTNLNLNRTNTKLDNVTYKLSSGSKINAAKDDPAGYAILKRLNRQLKGLDQADSNAGDAISSINTAEGALNEIHSILQRMNELAVQAANDTNVPEDRDTIQEEIAQLKDEINRIADTTDYNGTILLNGDGQRTSYVANDDDERLRNISILSQSTTVEPGDYQIQINSDPEKATTTLNVQAGKLYINGETLEVTQESINDNSIYDDIQKMCERCNIDVEQNGTSLKLTKVEYGSEYFIDAHYGDTAGTPVYGKDVDASIIQSDGGCDANTVISIEGNVIQLTNKDGFELKIATEKGATAEAGGTIHANIKDASTMQVQIGSEETNMLEIVYEKVSTETLGIDNVNVGSYLCAEDSIEQIQNAISKVASIRAKLGAYTNRIEYAQEDLSVQNYNITDATSRMGDTDMSESMTEYTELNVLEQATSSILSKANQRAETILQLLQT